MSKISSEIKILNHAEIQKEIIAKTVKIRPVEDLTGPFDKYNDELKEIYNKKQQQFLDTCKQYNKLNQETLFFNEERLYENYQQNLNCQFIDDDIFNSVSISKPVFF